MDLVSLIGSAAATVSAISTLARLVGKIAGEARDAPAELLDLRNELENTRAMLETMRQFLDSAPFGETDTPVSETVDVQEHLSLLRSTTEELSVAASEVINNLGRLNAKPYVIARFLRNRKVQRQRQSIIQARDTLSSLTVGLNLHLLKRHEKTCRELCMIRVGLDIESALMTVKHALQRDTEPDKGLTYTSWADEAAKPHGFARLELTLAESQLHQARKSPFGSREFIGAPRPMDFFIHVGTTLSGPCGRSCRCQCHVRYMVRNPGWESDIFGRLFLSYNRRGCDMSSCRRSSGTKAYFTYNFPTWLLRRALQLELHWGSPLDRGPAFSLTYAAQIPDTHDVWNTLTWNNIPRLQHLFSAGKLSPFDIGENGESLLL
ncbi:hypothetical protein B0H66DRAFT_213273 [Apodospora peruviana]|uniref:Fungal N-terminal domain-containing protein n=1 Tax=Apodospora peruviana TaxID=516989 RepID=A0AAE0ID00_9PEZI|nr:hypothetical protein B0H66DRAFT_213273 [Apodospora peruviana]